MKYQLCLLLSVLIAFLYFGSTTTFARQVELETGENDLVLESSNLADNFRRGRERPILHFDLLGEGEQFGPGTIARNRDGSIVKEMKHVSGAVWSPCGESFAYFSKPEPGQPQALMLETLEGKSKTVMTIPEMEILVWHPCWSPDGKRLACIVAREATEDVNFIHQADFSLQIVNAEKAVVEKSMEIPVGLLEWPSPTTPSSNFRWSPDGKHVLVSWAKSMVFTVETGRVTPISSAYSIAEWAPNSKSVFFFDFQPKDEGDSVGRFTFKGFSRRFLSQNSPELLVNAERLAELNIFEHPGVFDMRLLLSPKGKKLAMLVGAGKEMQRRTGCLLVYDVGADDEVIAFDQPAYRIEMDKKRIMDHPCFSPDEQQIACLVMTSWDELAIETLDLSDGAWTRLGVLSFRIGDYGTAAIDFIGWEKALSWTH